MRDDEVRETHPSFGLVSFSRVSCTPACNLFGSSIMHGNYIELRIHEAEKIRNLNYNRYHPNKEYISVMLSPSQFAEAITSMNCGVGVPCTIGTLYGERIDPCPEHNERQVFEKEFEDKVKKIMGEVLTLLNDTNKILDAKGPVKAADKAAIKAKVEKVYRDVRFNLPFVQSQFNEAVDNTVKEAKAELEAFHISRVIAYGMEAIQNETKPNIGALDAPSRAADDSPLALPGNG